MKTIFIGLLLLLAGSLSAMAQTEKGRWTVENLVISGIVPNLAILILEAV